MAKATLTFEDKPDGTITINIDMGDDIQTNSLAQNTALQCMKAGMKKLKIHDAVAIGKDFESRELGDRLMTHLKPTPFWKIWK